MHRSINKVVRNPALNKNNAILFAVPNVLVCKTRRIKNNLFPFRKHKAPRLLSLIFNIRAQPA